MRFSTILLATGGYGAIVMENSGITIPSRSIVTSITCALRRLLGTSASAPVARAVHEVPAPVKRSESLRRFPSGISRSTSLRRFESSRSLISEPDIEIGRFTNQRDLFEYLKSLSENESGFFGTDTTHKPAVDLWTKWEEIVPGWLLGTRDRDAMIAFANRIYWMNKTGVYTIHQLPGKVIKYYGSEIGSVSDPLDQVVVESYFLKLLEEDEIAPKLHFYSGYIPFPESTYQEFNRKVPEITSDGNPTIHVRYLIMDRMGPSVQHIALHGLDFSDAIYLGREMMLVLRRLHDKDIMHGDTHWGNFVLSSDDSDALMLIDFGRARIISPQDPPIECSPIIVDSSNPFKTKWGMKKCTPSFRDDVYRAIQMVPLMIYGREYYEFLKDLQGLCKSTYEDIKERADFWEFPSYKAVGLLLSNKIKDTQVLPIVRSKLNVLSTLVSRDDGDPRAKPQYDSIIEIFDEISALVSVEEPIRNPPKSTPGL